MYIYIDKHTYRLYCASVAPFNDRHEVHAPLSGVGKGAVTRVIWNIYRVATVVRYLTTRLNVTVHRIFDGLSPCSRLSVLEGFNI